MVQPLIPEHTGETLFLSETQISYATYPFLVEIVVGLLKLLLSSGVQLVTAEQGFYIL